MCSLYVYSLLLNNYVFTRFVKHVFFPIITLLLEKSDCDTFNLLSAKE